ncbi:MAG: helix-turn-helix domain-containing protein [Candidatus Pacearchaeota archaeon]
MMFWIFKRKKEIERIEEETKKSFEKVREDLLKVGKWIEHFDGKNKRVEEEIESIKEKIESIEKSIEELKGSFSIISKEPFKQRQTAVYKQTEAVDVQTAVQTAVQTGILDKLTLSERAIIFALLHSDMKLSYEDLAVMLGKDKSTIRGQINAIKQKSESLIKEIREPSGKKRVYIPQEIAKTLIKSVKVRVKKEEENEKKEKEEEN